MRDNSIILPRRYTDVWRLIACFLVVIGHYASVSIVNDWSRSPVWYAIASQAGYVGVAVFFFLSGFGVNESEQKKHENFYSFVKKRLLKLYKPILLVTVLWILVEFLFMGKELCLTVIYDIFWGFDDVVLWFIKILFGLYLSFYLYALLKINLDSLTIPYTVLIICLLVLIYIAHVTEGYSSIGIPCFLLGVIASEHKNFKIEALLLGLFMLGGIVFSYMTKDNHGYHASFNYIIIALIVSLPIVLKHNQNNEGTPSKLLAFLSLITLDVYLVHFKVLITMQETGLGGGSLLLFIIITMLASLALFGLRKFLKI